MSAANKRLAREARKLALECAAGIQPKRNPRSRLWGLRQWERAACIVHWRSGATLFTLGEGIVAYSSRIAFWSDDPHLLEFPLLALADEMEAQS